LTFWGQNLGIRGENDIFPHPKQHLLAQNFARASRVLIIFTFWGKKPTPNKKRAYGAFASLKWPLDYARATRFERHSAKSFLLVGKSGQYTPHSKGSSDAPANHFLYKIRFEIAAIMLWLLNISHQLIKNGHVYASAMIAVA
jgi:hypothetical protein